MKRLAQLALGLLLGVSAAPADDQAFTPAVVDSLVGPYLAVQKGLAGDDLKAAQAGTESFLEALKKAPGEDGSESPAAGLAAPAKAISDAGDIKAARTSFLDLSNRMIALVGEVGTSTDGALFVAHCPMAFDNAGGDWIQSDETIANPYYGSMMLRCGTVQKQIAGTD